MLQCLHDPSACLQVWKAWEGIAQHAKLQLSAASELQARHRRSQMQAFFRSWAGHAEDMQERRQVAATHGSAVAKRSHHSQLHLIVSVSFSAFFPWLSSSAQDHAALHAFAQI